MNTIRNVFFVSFVVFSAACYSPTRQARLYAAIEPLAQAVILDRFNEREQEYEKFYRLRVIAGSSGVDTGDPFGPLGPPKDDRRTIIYEPYCVLLNQADPSKDFLARLRNHQHPLRMGSEFKPHPTKFSSPEERVEFEYSNPPALFSIDTPEFLSGQIARIALTIYRGPSNAEFWLYILEYHNGGWEVIGKRMTGIS